MAGEIGAAARDTATVQHTFAITFANIVGAYRRDMATADKKQADAIAQARLNQETNFWPINQQHSAEIDQANELYGQRSRQLDLQRDTLVAQIGARLETNTAQSLRDNRLSEAQQELDRINQTEDDYLGAGGNGGWLAALHQADRDDRVTFSQAKAAQYGSIDAGGSAHTSFAKAEGLAHDQHYEQPVAEAQRVRDQQIDLSYRTLTLSRAQTDFTRESRLAQNDFANASLQAVRQIAAITAGGGQSANAPAALGTPNVDTGDVGRLSTNLRSASVNPFLIDGYYGLYGSHPAHGYYNWHGYLGRYRGWGWGWGGYDVYGGHFGSGYYGGYHGSGYFGTGGIYGSAYHYGGGYYHGGFGYRYRGFGFGSYGFGGAAGSHLSSPGVPGTTTPVDVKAEVDRLNGNAAVAAGNPSDSSSNISEHVQSVTTAGLPTVNSTTTQSFVLATYAAETGELGAEEQYKADIEAIADYDRLLGKIGDVLNNLEELSLSQMESLEDAGFIKTYEPTLSLVYGTYKMLTIGEDRYFYELKTVASGPAVIGYSSVPSVYQPTRSFYSLVFTPPNKHYATTAALEHLYSGTTNTLYAVAEVGISVIPGGTSAGEIDNGNYLNAVLYAAQDVAVTLSGVGKAGEIVYKLGRVSKISRITAAGVHLQRLTRTAGQSQKVLVGLAVVDGVLAARSGSDAFAAFKQGKTTEATIKTLDALLGAIGAGFAANDLVKVRAKAAAAAERIANAPIGGAGGVRGIGGLRNADNFVPGRLQPRADTCGLNCAFDALQDIGVSGKFRVGSELRDLIRAQGGLEKAQLARFIESIDDSLAAVVKTGVGLDDISGAFGRGGRVIAFVDGNHWVRVMNVFTKDGKTYVRIFDSGRGGYYDQLWDSFFTRMGADNAIINIFN